MSSLQIGDEVRVVSPASQWQDWCGTIVDIVNRKSEGDDATLQECLVILHGERRWFMADHLARTVPQTLVRFFRPEVIERWKLDPDQGND
jgi:hypothetical protein